MLLANSNIFNSGSLSRISGVLISFKMVLLLKESIFPLWSVSFEETIFFPG